ncbi:MAG: hypothetical protein LIO79_02160 [Rikenellaceae bacterium]|nr:hypothetical protein [Rikenellaceae bacterium]
MLGVSQGEYYVPKKDANYSIIVTTDYPGGWVEGFDLTAYPWLQFVSGSFGGINSKDEVIFHVDENPNDTERIGYFTFTAGRLVYTVKVTQGIENGLSLELVDNDGKEVSELVFLSGIGGLVAAPQIYYAKWTPEESPVMISSVSTSNISFNHESGYDDPVNFTQAAGGSQLHNILPTKMSDSEVHEETGDPFLEKSTRYNYVVTDGSDVAAKTILLRQIHYNLIAIPEDKYELNGSTYTLYVRSNAEWTAVLTKDNDKAIASPSSWSGGIDTDQGTPIQFTVINTTDIASTTAEITFTYKGEYGQEQTKVVVLNLYSVPDIIMDPVGHANSYMLRPGGNGVEFPVAQANKDNVTRIGANDDIELRLLWTDTPAYLGSDAAVQSFSLNGTGASATISVAPGSKEGNAVIAAVVDNKIRWSWHIWVVDYDPDVDGSHPHTAATNTVYDFMLYNLGAIDNTPGMSGTLGLLYQWGRKDPFPGLAGISSADPTTIYGAPNTVTTTPSVVVPYSNNFENSIENPMDFFYGASGNNHDWYGAASGTVNSSLWDDGTNIKTTYDPCPYGWRVPHDKNGTIPWANEWTASWNNTTKSITYANLGVWQAAGIRNGSNGNYSLLIDTGNGIAGYYWGATNNGSTQSRNFEFYSNGNTSYYQTKARGYGFSVRCVRDENPQ